MSVANYLANSAIEKFFGNGTVYVKVYNDTGSAISNGAIKVVSEKWITGKGVVLALTAAATNATESNVIGIVDNSPGGQSTIPDASYGWCLVQGLYGSLAEAYGASTSGTVAANDQLEVIDTGTAFIDSGNNGGQVILTETCAIAVELVDTDVWSVYLIGRNCSIQAA